MVHNVLTLGVQFLAHVVADNKWDFVYVVTVMLQSYIRYTRGSSRLHHVMFSCLSYLTLPYQSTMQQ